MTENYINMIYGKISEVTVPGPKEQSRQINLMPRCSEWQRAECFSASRKQPNKK